VLGAVRAVASQGIGILLVEQNATAALAIADHAHVLEQGEITLSGTAAEVRDHPLVVRAFLGLDDSTGDTAPPAEPAAPNHLRR
jgi:branched-chain amino acid transport system ATP-binding protein